MRSCNEDAHRIQTIGKASGSALRVHRLLQTLTASLKHLAKLGIARETTGRNYGRIYAYDKYLMILNEGTEPLNERKLA